MPLEWGFISVTSATFQGSNTLTLTEPISAQAGDLFVLALAGRGTVYPTIPSGWTLVASVGGGNTSTTANSGIANAQMAYHVRAGSAPTLVFSRAGGDVYGGLIACYRNARGGAVFDVAAVQQLAVHSTTATVSAGITTVEDKELIVAMVAGGDNVAVSSAHAITNPKSGSGALSTTDPTSFQWLERRDQTSTVGADTGVSILDALMPVAGATGAIRAIMAGSARHAMAVAAFRITPAVDATDKLFLKEGGPTYEHQFFHIWREFVTDVSSTSVSTGGGGPTLRSATDYLFLRDQRVSLLEKRVVDKTFLADTLLRAIESRQTDRVLIPDSLAKQLHKVMIDGLLLNEARRSERHVRATDKTFIKDAPAARFATEIVVTDEALLLGDLASRTPERTRLARDGLMLLDAITMLLDKRMIDKLLLGDSANRLLEKRLLDKMFLNDSGTTEYTAGSGGLNTRSASDGLYLSDTVQRALSKLIIDKLLIATPPGRREDSVFFQQGVLLQDRIVRLMVKLIMDKVLLKDTDAEEITGGAAAVLRSGLDKLLLGESVRKETHYRLTDKLFILDPGLLQNIEQSTVDKLLVADQRTSLLAKSLTDKLLVADRRLSVLDRAMIDKLLTADRVLKVLEKRMSEGLLLSDSVSFSTAGIIVRSAVDYVLLADTIMRQQDMRASEGLLLNDAVMRELVKRFVDQLLLRDSASTQLTFGGAVTAVNVSDSLLLSDSMVKTLLARMSEGLLLIDIVHVVKEMRREAVDKFLLADRRLSERGITRGDILLLQDITTRAMQIVMREGLLVPDSSAAQWFPVVVEFMTYIRLALRSLLGVQSANVPVLGRELGAVPLLWRDTSVVYVQGT